MLPRSSTEVKGAPKDSKRPPCGACRHLDYCYKGSNGYASGGKGTRRSADQITSRPPPSTNDSKLHLFFYHSIVFPLLFYFVLTLSSITFFCFLSSAFNIIYFEHFAFPLLPPLYVFIEGATSRPQLFIGENLNDRLPISTNEIGTCGPYLVAVFWHVTTCSLV